MTELDDRLARRLVQEVADNAPSPAEWGDVIARTTPEVTPAPRAAPRRSWVPVAATAGIALAVTAGVVVYQRSGSGTRDEVIAASTPPPALATSVPSATGTAAPSTTSQDASVPSDSATAVFAPSLVPDGFAVVEAATRDGAWPSSTQRVDTETWVVHGDDGGIDGYVRLSAGVSPHLPNLLPRSPTGVTVHGEVADVIAETASAGSSVSWAERGMTLRVSTWGSDAVAIAEQTIVTSSGITLPSGTLPDAFVRVDGRVDPAVAVGRSSSVSWVTSDGERMLRLGAEPNIAGDTFDTIVPAPGARREAVGSTDVWVWSTDAGTSAAWLAGDHLLTAAGDLDEQALLAFVASVGRTSDEGFRSLILDASAIDEAITERDRGRFSDGVEISVHSAAAIDVPESSSFGPRSLCATGDATFCTTQVTPITEGGLLTMLAGWQTIGGERQMLVWVGAGRTVTRVYDADSGADATFTTTPGAHGSFARASVPAGVRSVVVETLVPGRPYPDMRRVNADLSDPLADVMPPNPPAG